MKNKVNKNVIELKNNVVTSLETNKIKDITVIDLTEKTDIADYMVIGTGTSETHIKSSADLLIQNLKKNNLCKKFSVEGVSKEGWILVDTLDVIVHLFNEETRKIYNLELMWNQ